MPNASFFLQILEGDPYSVPQSALEDEPIGGKTGESERARARRYLLSVRKRKGLATDEQLVVRAEKQRTLKKNK